MYVVRVFLVVCAVFISVVTTEASGKTVVSGQNTDSLNRDAFGKSTKQLSYDYDCGCTTNSYCEIDKIITPCSCVIAFNFSSGNSEKKCSTTQPCPNEGQCLDNVCQCPNGKDGEFCQIGEYCNSLCDGINGDVKIGVFIATSKSADCRCPEKAYSFDDYSKNCSFCDCGSYSRECSVVLGKKHCTCLTGYADRLGECTECVCGPNEKCSFDNRGDKTCRCNEGYALQGGTCTKILQTSPIPTTYIPTQPKILQTSPISTTYIPTQPSCDCGVKSFECKLDDQGRKLCFCMPGFAQNADMCEKCDCGPNGKCRFEDTGSKICDCDRGYVQNEYLLRCMACDCGSYGYCFFNVFNVKTCTCKEGYRENGGKCKACDCGSNGICRLENWGTKVCECDLGYVEYRGTCKACDCGDHGECLFEKGVKACKCKKGFSEKLDGKCYEICDAKCMNGTCEITGKSSKCVCDEGFTGFHCDEKITKKEDYSAYLIGITLLCVAILVLILATLGRWCVLRRFTQGGRVI